MAGHPTTHSAPNAAPAGEIDGPNPAANEPDPVIELCVLGPMEACVDGAVVDLGGPKQRTVLAVLAAHAGRTVSTDRLIEAVYGQSPGTGARRSLQTFVSNLRRIFGDGLHRQGDGYRLDAAAVKLDLVECERLYHHAVATDDPAGAVDVLRRADTMWRGAPFEDIDGHTVLDAEITRLRERRLLEIEARIESELKLGRHAAVIGELEALVADHPFRERFTCQLMVALYRAGRQAEALRAYNRLRTQLVEELGIDPSETTRLLEQRVLDQDPELLEVGDKPHSQWTQEFEIGSLIGEGRFARVYRGRQTSVDREVAVKAIRPEFAHHPEFLRRFDGEARLVARLEHPHIVPIYEYWRDPDGAYIAMRLLRGGSTADALALGPWGRDRVARLITQIGSAAAAAHRIGVVHRDIKPGNILLDDDGNGYLGDFGIAKIMGRTPATTDIGSPATPGYSAPEVLRGHAPEPQTDVYALAIVAYELLSGTHPYPVETVPAMISHHLHDPLPSLHEQDAAIPVAVDRVLAKAAAKSPSQRYEDANAFALELADALGAGVPAPPTNGESQPAHRPPAIEDFITDETPFGPIAMDEISTRDVYDALYDRDNRIHAEIVRRHPSFIVGRRGAGKTALMRAPLLDPRNLLVEFKSADLFAHVLHCVESIERSQGRMFVKQVSDIWEGVVWSGLCLAALQSTTAPNETRADLFTLQRFVAGLGDVSAMSVDDVGASYCRALAESADDPGSGQAVAMNEAKEACLRVLRHRDLHPVVLIDSMEDLHTEFDTLARPMAGLFGLIGRADRSAVPDCDFRFCYPSELWMKLGDLAANPLKDAENHVTIHWQARELLKIAGNRLAIYLRLHHPSVLADVVGRRSYNPKSLDDARAVLAAVLPRTVVNRVGTEETAVAYIMRHTQLLPRHLLRILNGIMRRNREAGGDPTAVAPEAVVEGVRQVEELLAVEIFSAYSAVHPLAREACRRALPELRTSFRDGDLHRAFNRTGIAKTTGMEYFEFKEMLIEIGALGRVLRHTDRYVEAEFDYTLPSPLFPGHHEELCLHPLFTRVFQAHTEPVANGGNRVVYPYGSDPADSDGW